MTKLTLATIVGACVVTGTIGTIAVTSMVKTLPQKNKTTTKIEVPIGNMANSMEMKEEIFLPTEVTTGTTITGVTTEVTTLKGTETTVVTTTVTGDNGTDESAPNDNTNNKNEEKVNPNNSETPTINNNAQPTQNEQPKVEQTREEVKPVEQPKAEETQQRVEEVKPVEQSKVEEPVQQSNPKDGLDIVVDNGASGIARLDSTTYGEYIDNWSYCSHTFKMPTPDMKWYNETQDVINTARAEGKDEFWSWQRGACYYASRMYYNEDLDVMYEDGYIWVYIPAEDGYRVSSVTW